MEPPRWSVDHPVPGWVLRLRRRRGAGHRDRGASASHAARHCAGLATTVPARDHQLRPVPLALAGRPRARRRPDRHQWVDALRAPECSGDRDRRRLVPLARAPGAPRCVVRAAVGVRHPGARGHPRRRDLPWHPGQRRIHRRRQGARSALERGQQRARPHRRASPPGRRLGRGHLRERAPQCGARRGRCGIPRVQGRARHDPGLSFRSPGQRLPVGDRVAPRACRGPTPGSAPGVGSLRALGRAPARLVDLARAGDPGVGPLLEGRDAAGDRCAHCDRGPWW